MQLAVKKSNPPINSRTRNRLLLLVLVAPLSLLLFMAAQSWGKPEYKNDRNITTETLTNPPQLAAVQLPPNSTKPFQGLTFIPKSLEAEHKEAEHKTEHKLEQAPKFSDKIISVKKNESLAKILNREGISYNKIARIQEALSNADHKGTIYPGQKLMLTRDENNRAMAIVLPINKKQNLVIGIEHEESLNQPEKTEWTSVTAEVVTQATEKRVAYRSGTIQSSLFKAANKAGISDKLIMEMADLFAWDVDFVYDIRKGDSFKLFYEEEWLNNNKIEEGRIIAAEFNNQGRALSAIYFENEDTNTKGYFTKDGSSVKKAFLRSPVNFARISSHFNLKRKHPVLHKIRAHKGVDYAAGRGTPIKSTGQGTVIFKGAKGGYGKTIILQHGSKYTTLYAHLHKYHRKLRKGSKVKQGQIIGYVGSSGLATGPHLHYEFRVNKVHKNPVTVKLPKAASIPLAAMPAFKQQLVSSQSLFNRYQVGEYALLDSSIGPEAPGFGSQNTH